MSAEVVDVCVCTYRRETLTTAIRSLGALEPRSLRVRLIVVDNDDVPSARLRAERAAVEARLDLVFVHAPARNIAIARNAALDAVGADWLAFIDDDEEVAPDWLARLVLARADADIVFGPVIARYRDGAPAVLRKADLHKTVPPPGRALVSGYAGNVLMRRDAIQRAGLRFDPRFGVTGGEDTVFFYTAAKKGLRLHFAANALAFEDVPEVRERLSWLWRRRVSAGEAFAFCLHRISGQGPLRTAVAAGAKALVFAFVTFATLVLPHLALRNGARLGFHMGVLAYCLKKHA